MSTPDRHPRLDLVSWQEELGEDERAVQGAVREALEAHVRPHVRGWYADGALPVRDVARALGEVGLLGMHLDGYGCAGMSAVQYGLACLELEAVDSGVRSLVSVQGSLAMYAIHAHGSPEQRERWLPAMARGEAIGCFGLTEPDHGSDPASMRTRARRDGSDWLLTGTKTWITNGPVADVAVVWAQTGEGPDDVRGFVVPTDAPGFTAREITGKMSLRASVTGELALQDVRLPADAVLPGVEGMRGPLGCLTEARYGIVWGAMGAARDCLETTLDYAATREQFGRPIAAFQLTQDKLARAAVDLATGSLLALHLGRRKDRGTLRPHQVSVGKLDNVDKALAIARTCRTVLGANGISEEYPLMRHANNLESVLTYEGTAEMHTLVLGQRLTGEQAFR